MRRSMSAGQGALRTRLRAGASAVRRIRSRISCLRTTRSSPVSSSAGIRGLASFCWMPPNAPTGNSTALQPRTSSFQLGSPPTMHAPMPNVATRFSWIYPNSWTNAAPPSRSPAKFCQIQPIKKRFLDALVCTNGRWRINQFRTIFVTTTWICVWVLRAPTGWLSRTASAVRISMRSGFSCLRRRP